MMATTKLVSPTGKPITLRPVLTNSGIHAAYRRKLTALVQEMHDSLLYWLSAAYKQAEAPAMDSAEHVRKVARLPAKIMQDAMARMKAQWYARFDDGAQKLAVWFAQKQKSYADVALKTILKDAGFTVAFKVTPAMQNTLDAVVSENVALIKSIGSQHLTQVEGLVMRAAQSGRDLGPLAKQLEAQFSVTKRRAAFISRDQSNKATASLNSTRQQELGITTGKWRHSGAGKEPRPSHVAANGKLFDLDKGMLLDGEWVLPGQAINCLPGDSVIEFAAGCKKLWRRRYSGDLTEIVTASGKTIKATPNHPVLTGRGWVPIQFVNLGDDVIRVPDEVGDALGVDVEADVATFSQIFDAVAPYILPGIGSGARFEFHGDVSDGEVETIDFDGFLPDEIDGSFCKSFAELFFAKADHVLIGAGFNSDGSLYTASRRLFCAPESVIRGFSALLPLLRGHGAHAGDICRRLASDLHAAFKEAGANSGSGYAIALGKLKLANSGLVIGCDQVIGELFNLLSRASVLWYGDAPSADALGEKIGRNSEKGRNILKGLPAGYAVDSVVNKRVFDSCDHVYNLENGLNWYSSNTCIIHNCRCSWAPVIPGFID